MFGWLVGLGFVCVWGGGVFCCIVLFCFVLYEVSWVGFGFYYLSNKSHLTWTFNFFAHIPLCISGTYNTPQSGSASNNTL